MNPDVNRRSFTQRKWFIPFMLALVVVTAILASAITYKVSGDDKPASQSATGAPNSGQVPTVNVPYRDVPRGCEPMRVDQPTNTAVINLSDPLCGSNLTDAERDQLITYRNYYQNEPAFNCADGRNNGRDADDMIDFEACPNGMLHVTITNGTMALVSATGPVKIVNDVNLATANDNPGDGWTLYMGTAHVTTTTHDNGTVTTNPAYRLIGYDYHLALQRYMAFERKDGGPWTVSINTNDHSFYDSSTYEVVFTWTDPRAQNVPAAMPPGFDWDCVPNYNYGKPRKQC